MNTNNIVMWEILLNNADWDCLKILFAPPSWEKESLEIQAQSQIRIISRSDWIDLIVASEQCDVRAAISRSRSNRRAHDDLESRAARAEMLVSLGKLSSARQAFERAALVL